MIERKVRDEARKSAMFFRLPTVPRPRDCRVGESVTSSPSRVSLAGSLDRSQVTYSPAQQAWRTASNLKQSRRSRACLSLETPATQAILSEWSTSEENYLAFFFVVVFIISINGFVRHLDKETVFQKLL